MNTRFFFFAAILFSLAFFTAGINAAQTLSVQNIPAPDGCVSGTTTISWDYSDSTNSQDQNCQLFYSTVAGAKNNDITSVDCLDYCPFSTQDLFENNSSFYTNGLPDLSVDFSGYRLNGQPRFFVYDSDLYSLIPIATFPTITTAKVLGFKFNNATDSWLPDNDINAGLNWTETFFDISLMNFKVFDLSGTTYMLAELHGYGSLGFVGYSFNGTTWSFNSDINHGLTEPIPFSTDQTFVEYYNNFIIIYANDTSPSVQSYDWNGAGWERNDFYVIDLNFTHSAMGGFSIFNDGILRMLEFDLTNESANAGVFANGKWNWGNDWNLGVPTENIKIAGDTVFFDGNHLLFLTDGMTTNNGTTDWNSYAFGNAFNTQTSQTCNFNWNTSAIQDFPAWFVDLTVTNGESDTITASSNSFASCNQTYEQIIIHDIDNISHVIDGNIVRLNPDTDIEDFTFSVDANGFSGTILFRIENADKSLSQYFADTATPQEYIQRAWSFNDSITFGDGSYDAIQKRWNNLDAFYYTWTDTLASDSNKFYRFRYEETMDAWFSLNNSDWEVQLTPNVVDFNGISRDQFTVSTYSDLSNLLIKELPIIYDSDLDNSNFVFQFNVFSDVARIGELKAASVELRELDPATTFNSNTSERRITVKDLDNEFFKMISAASAPTLYSMGIYNLIERGYFVDSLEILDFDNSPLPILITDTNGYYPYIKEGSPFRVRTRVRDPQNKLDSYEVTVYVGGIASANKIKIYKFDFEDSDSDFKTINPVLDGVIDLTTSAPDRDLLITVKVFDDDSKYSEVQEGIIKLRQFPSTPADIRFNFFQQNHKVGDNPQGRIELVTSVPSNIIGVKLELVSTSQDGNVSDYNKIFYKDQDFTCLGVDCSFDYTLTEYKFPREDTYIMKGWALITTENESITNEFLYKQIIFPVYYKIFETYRILQTRERTDFNYHNTETIPLVIQVRDSDYANMQNEVVAKIRLWECDTDNVVAEGNCFQIDINYNYDDFLYDTATGYNYWFFNQIFLESNLTKLSDGNFFRVEGLLEDKELKHQFLQKTLLTDRCEEYDLATFFYNALTMNVVHRGCTVYNIPFLSVTINQGNERRIGIKNSRVNSASTQECFVCINADQDNVYVNALEQDLFCAAIYKLGEQPIDKFRLYVTNRYSDLTQTKYAQFLEINVPAELIYSNDIFIMQQSLNEEFGTNQINTINEMLAAGFNYLGTGTANAVLDLVETATSTGWISNVGIDCDFSKAIHPNYVSGFLFYRVKGLKVINQKDYEASYPEMANLDPSRFVSYSSLNDIRIPENETTIEVFASDMKKVAQYTVPSQLVINEEIKYNPINIANVDVNYDVNGADIPKYETAPTRLKFNFISDMITNNDRNVIRRYVPITLSVILTKDCGLFGLACAGDILDIFTKGDPTWLIQNWFFLGAFVVTLLVFGMIWRFWRGNQSNVNIFNRK